MNLSEETLQKVLKYQKTEITEYRIYSKLAVAIKSPANRQVFERIAAEELEHCNFWRTHTGREVRPNNLTVWRYYLISRLLGFTFGAKLMERGEERAQANYEALRGVVPEIETLITAEEGHENTIIDLLDEEALRYTGAVVLGLNDALVELTGVLAGLTLALQNTGLIALTGLITGVAAALSMAASEYLSTKADEPSKSPGKASLYTGIAYIVTVLVLIAPYLILNNLYLSLAVTLAISVLIIAGFNYYVSVAKDMPFRGRFFEMVGLSLGIAAFTFLFGFLVRKFLGVQL